MASNASLHINSLELRHGAHAFADGHSAPVADATRPSIHSHVPLSESPHLVIDPGDTAGTSTRLLRAASIAMPNSPPNRSVPAKNNPQCASAKQS